MLSFRRIDLWNENENTLNSCSNDYIFNIYGNCIYMYLYINTWSFVFLYIYPQAYVYICVYIERERV